MFSHDALVGVKCICTTGKPDSIAYYGKWLERGQHINSIGATGGKLREIDPECFARAECIQVDSLEQVREESGDSTAAIVAGAWHAERFVEMPGVISGRASARTDASQITLLKSVGTGVQDVMAGFAVYAEARRLGIGTDVPEFLEHKTF